ncbi:MAG: sigma-70 family RNA polymerase sigma factor [bacterium]|nr:sigma-70 family RNA polymerase sigma factor [bacterium]
MDADLHDEFDAELRADVRWLRELAVRLIRDPALADDAVQEAWLAADRSGRTNGPERRGVLFRAMRRFAWRWRRAEGRRSRHEAAGSRSFDLPSTAELLSRGEERQRLWRRLTELAEPYRTTLLLRYQEGLDTRAIARRFEAPEDTVRRRIRRGLELLRERYQQDGDQPGRGLSALALVAWPVGNPSTTVANGDLTGDPAGATNLATPAMTSASTGAAVLIGAWMMKKSVAVAAIVIAASVLGGIAWHANQSPEPPPEEHAASRVGAANGAVVAAADGKPQNLERTAAEPSAPTATEPANAVQGCRVTGLVIDGKGHPFQGATVQLLGGPDHWSASPTWTRETRTGMDGSFELLSNGLQRDEPVRLVVSASPLHVRLERSFGGEADADFGALAVAHIDVGQLRLTAAGMLAGRVLAEDGTPIEGAWIDAANGREFTRSLPNGHFELPRLWTKRKKFTIKAAGYLVQRHEVKLTAGAITRLGDVTLTTAPRVTGIVTDLTGRPLPGARVSTRGFTRGWVFDTAPDATFDVPLPEDEPGKVIARADGFVQSDGTRVVPGQREVRIALAPRAPRGRFAVVERATGEPVKRFAIRIRKNTGSAAGDDRQPPSRWYQRQFHHFKTGRALGTCRVGFDEVEVNAPGFRPAIAEVAAAAFEATGQRIALDRAPRLRGRIVDAAGNGVPELPLRLLFGGLGRVTDHATGEAPDLPRDSQLGRMLRKQGGYSMFDMLNLEDPDENPLPPVVLARFGGLREHKTYTDEHGRFHFEVSIGVGRVVANSPDGHVLTNDHFVFATEAELQLGEIALVEPASLRGKLLPNLPVDLTGTLVELQSSPGRRARVGRDGSFQFEDLAPGEHWFRVQVSDRIAAPELLGRSWYLRLAPGQRRDIEIELPVQASCRLTATLHVNGQPATDAEISFWREGVRQRAGEIEIGESGAGVGTVQANVAVRARIRVADTMLPQTEAFVLPSGEFERKFELQTAALTVRLPETFELPEDGNFRLRFYGPAGGAGGPLQLRISGSNRILGSQTTRDLRIVFPHVPAHATRFDLAVQSGGPYSESPWRTIGNFEQALVGGESATVTLR